VTDRRDFKRRVRDRQAETGETYTAARRAVEAQRPGAMALVEMTDVTDVAATVGFACRAVASPDVLAAVTAEAALRRLHKLLVAVDADAETAVMRAFAFRDTPPPALTEDDHRGIVAIRDFLARARAGVGGTLGAGRLIVLHDAIPIVYMIWPIAPYPLQAAPHPSRLVITTLDLFVLAAFVR
jgi:hypothetical protein